MSAAAWAAQPWIQGIGWGLVHSLWQGALVVAAVRLLAAAGPDDPRRRHRLAAAGLALMLAAAAATAVREAHRAAEGAGTPAWTQAAMPAPEPAAAREAGSHVTAEGAEAAGLLDGLQTSRIEPIRRMLDSAMPALVAAWACGVLLLGVRLGRGWQATRRVRTRGVRALPADWDARVRRLAARMRLSRPLRALQSAAADVPMVIGALRPVLLVPASLLTGMPAAQLELLIAHELAHVRRHDYLINLLQAVAETLLFYHPAVWWVSGQVRQERESCCDD
ncbi:MAG TPA: M56 family metallopeptidase, partial [Longimicrobium sp.]|nr:M56 family metallopeptidase [Longimicrobium sp.]